ncbi:MAG: alpha/beta hydrolase [Pseudomonadota bacterium]
MNLQVDGHTVYCYTGGRAFDAAKPTVVFVHGVLNDHSVFGLQTRYLAHHGWNVLAPDLPGHCRSGGEPPRSVEEAAGFIVALLDAAGLRQAGLVGHSFGSLAVLEAAARAPDRVSRMALLATAFPMMVSAAMLDAARDDPPQAIALDNRFSHATLAPPPSSLGPGTWVYGLSLALMRRVQSSNPRANLAYTGFKACNDYQGGDAAMAQVRCPVLFVLGRADAMTPPAMAQGLAARARDGRTVMVEAGHDMMAEAPDAVLFALREFLKP